MKKFYVLSALLVVLFSACKKEAAPKQEEEKFKPTDFSTPFFVNPGTGSTIVQDPADGKYKATYSGVNLEFSPVPTNTNYVDKDPGQVGMSCTNCVEFHQNGDYFTAIIGVLPSSYLEDARSKITKFADELQRWINGDKDANGQFKQPTYPIYPVFNYYATITGVVVRSHSSPSSLVIYPSTLTPNTPHVTTTLPTVIGGMTITDGTESVFYDLVMNGDHQISQVEARNISTNVVLSNITWSGVAYETSPGSGQYKVTLKIYREGVLVVDVTDFTLVE